MSTGNVTVLALLLILFCDSTSSECTQLTPCSCMFSNGQGYDLTSLSNMGVLNATSPDYVLYFQPCKNAKLTSNDSSECNKGNGVSLCAQDTVKNVTVSLGTVEETTITMQPSNNEHPVLILRHGKITTMISVLCCVPCKTRLFIDSIPNPMQYNLILESPHACRIFLHKGLSIGSILVILFCVLTGLYFIGGAIILSIVRGAEGWERVPNYQFWCVTLPALVREGIVVTFSCFQPNNYESI